MSDITNERVILASLVKNEQFTRTLLPFIKKEYFTDDESEARMFQKVYEFVTEYNAMPDKSTLIVNVKNDYDMTERESDDLVETINDVFSLNPTNNFDWLKETTATWCQNKAVYNAIQKAISIYQGEDTKMTIAAIPDLLSKAISVDFDTKIGLEYFDSAEYRYEFYSSPDSRLPFRMRGFNEVTCGGVIRKTLNLLVAGVNVGKTLGLISLGADYVRDGLNVLYISGEMREEMIMNRLDGNLLDVNINDITSLGKEKFMSRVENLKQKSYGRFVVKEFPPGTATALNIKTTIDELKMKKDFVPDVIICDYLQIMASYRVPYSAGSYYYFKAVAEELRALAVSTNTTVWSAAQFNRGAMNSTEVGMEDIAESTGIAQTADGMWALMRTEELDQMGQLLVKQLKSRYANKAVKLKFCIGVNVDKQQLFDLDDDRSDELVDSGKVEVSNQTDLKAKFKAANKFEDLT